MSEPEKTEERILFSNVSIVRDQSGKLNMYVGQEKVIGISGIAMSTLNSGDTVWQFNIPGDRVRVAERVPAQPVYEANNVVAFKATKVTAKTPDTPKGTA